MINKKQLKSWYIWLAANHGKDLNNQIQHHLESRHDKFHRKVQFLVAEWLGDLKKTVVFPTAYYKVVPPQL